MNQTVYHIRDWARLYEGHETRKLKNLAWVKVTNNLDSEGYCALVEHPNAAAHLGVWLLLLEIASRCKPRGWLIRSFGGPHTAETLAIKTRLPVAIIAEALPRLVEIGWLAESPDMPGDEPDESGRETGDEPDDNRMEAGIDKTVLDGTVEDGKRQKSARDSFSSESQTEKPDRLGSNKFGEFWAQYTKKTKQAAAARAYSGAITGPAEHAALMAGLQRWISSDQWTRSRQEDGGRFIPCADRFISDRLYADEPAPYNPTARRSGKSDVAGMREQFLNRHKAPE